jgi:hypothetical protein
VYYSTAKNFAAATKFAVEPTEPAVMVTGLADSTVYNFWVVAKNSGGSSTRSPIYTAPKTSDGIPDYLKTCVTPGGPAAHYRSSNAGDYYHFQDLGEAYPAHERYLFAYGGGSGLGGEFYPGGVLKFVVKFANPPEEPAILLGMGQEIKENQEHDINRGVLIYEFQRNGRTKYQATYYLDEHLGPETRIDYQGFSSHPPAAVMGQANGYTSGLGNTQETDTLEEAITKYAKIGEPPIGGGGRYDYFTDMRIYYGLDPNYTP